MVSSNKSVSTSGFFSRPAIRLGALWAIAALAYVFLQLAYQVSEWVAFACAALLTAFAILLSWSASRVNVANASGIIKLLLMSAVVGLMTSQALDIAYQVAALPAGGRFGVGVEVAYFAALVFPISYLGGRLWPRTQPEVQTDSDRGD